MVFIPFNKWWKLQKLSPTYTTHILKNWHPDPTSHVFPVFPPYLRKPSDSCNSWFCSIVFAKACSNEPCGESSPPCEVGIWGAPKEHGVFTTSLSTSDRSAKIMISGENQLPFWKKWKISLLTQLGRKGATSDYEATAMTPLPPPATTTTTTTTKIQIMELPNNCRKG